MNTQLRQCFARAFRLKKARKKPNFSGFFISKKSQSCFNFWLKKSQIGCNPDQRFSVFIFAETYAALLYYVMIHFCVEHKA